MKEVIAPFFATKDAIELMECYMDLAIITDELASSIFSKQVQCKKGVHFKGTFGEEENDENVLLIFDQDFKVMINAVEKYNSIIGRRDILNDLDEKLRNLVYWI